MSLLCDSRALDDRLEAGLVVTGSGSCPGSGNAGRGLELHQGTYRHSHCSDDMWRHLLRDHWTRVRTNWIPEIVASLSSVHDYIRSHHVDVHLQPTVLHAATTADALTLQRHDKVALRYSHGQRHRHCEKGRSPVREFRSGFNQLWIVQQASQAGRPQRRRAICGPV